MTGLLKGLGYYENEARQSVFILRGAGMAV